MAKLLLIPLLALLLFTGCGSSTAPPKPVYVTKTVENHWKTNRLKHRVHKLHHERNKLGRMVRKERRLKREYKRQAHIRPRVEYRYIYRYSLPTNIVSMGYALQSRGYTVLENPHFGGVHHVHVNGSYHYPPCSCAIDVSGGRCLPCVASVARQAGFFVLWQVPGHYDHVH